MQVIEQSWEWIKKPDTPLQLIELAGRTCYKSEDKITPESSAKFVKRILDSGHHSVIEHANASVRFITNRGITHEIVRHRLAAYSQESTRYCNYGGNHIKFIKPTWCNNIKPNTIYTLYPTTDNNLTYNEFIWIKAMIDIENFYKTLIANDWRPEQAREVLPNALKTEIIMTCNLREWRHVFKLRTSKAAHPQIVALMKSCLEGFKAEVPILFDDIGR